MNNQKTRYKGEIMAHPNNFPNHYATVVEFFEHSIDVIQVLELLTTYFKRRHCFVQVLNPLQKFETSSRVCFVTGYSQR